MRAKLAASDSQAPRPTFRAQRKSLLAFYWGYLDHKLMNFPHDLAVKTLLLEQTCDLDRQFRKKRLVIWAGKRQTG